MPSPLVTLKLFAPQLKASREGDGRMRLDGIASSTVRDHHGDTISLKALRKMADSALGMTIFMNHEYRVPEDVFGTVETARISKSSDVDAKGQPIYDLRLGIVVAGTNEQAVQTWDLIDKDKVKLGLSIGAMLPEGGVAADKTAGGRMLIDDIDIVETSVISIPANPRSFIDYAMKAMVGVFPDSKKFAEHHAAFLKDFTGAEWDSSVAEPEIIDEAPLVALGDVVELTVKADGSSTTEVVAEAGSAEAIAFVAEAGDPEHPIDLTPGIALDGTPDVTTSDAPDLEKAKVTVWENPDGTRVTEVNTGRSKPPTGEDQSAQTESETAGGSADGEGVSKDLVEAIRVATVSGGNAAGLLKAVVGQLKAKEAENATLRSERDAAIEVAKQALIGTQQILVRVGQLPAGRKTLEYPAIQRSFDDLTEIYGPEVLKHMQPKALQKGT